MSRRNWVLVAGIVAIGIIVLIHHRGMPEPVPTPPGSFSFGVFGDAPYYPDEELQYPILLKHIDAHDVSFMIHVGDIFWHPCSDEHYAEVLRNFNGLHMPVIYTPGDNEWTDCWEEGSGGYQPRERLARIRRIFFANPNRSLGAHPIPLTSQGGELVENARWQRDGVVFATVDIPGSRNGMAPFPGRTVEDDAEVRRRTEAAAAWTRAAFAEARATSARAVVIAFQANMHLDMPNKRMPFEPFVQTIEQEAKQFGKPVLLAHGDGHIYIVDHPMPGLANVTRLQVPGSPQVGWVRVVVLPGEPARFQFTKIVVPRWRFW